MGDGEQCGRWIGEREGHPPVTVEVYRRGRGYKYSAGPLFTVFRWRDVARHYPGYTWIGAWRGEKALKCEVCGDEPATKQPAGAIFDPLCAVCEACACCLQRRDGLDVTAYDPECARCAADEAELLASLDGETAAR